MPEKTAYLDNSATTQVCPEAARAALDAMTHEYGNPSSLHRPGLAAEHLIEHARAEIARTLGVQPGEITFTSGGTESNNLALLGAAMSRRHEGNRIVTTLIEHPSVLRTVQELERRGFEVIRLTPGRDGKIDPDALMQAVTKDTVLVSMMAVNNETGAVQPVEAMRRAVQAAGAPALVHCDAVQGYGRLDLKPARLGVDLMSLSGHKIHAPKGTGALYVRSGVRLTPQVFGGGQERDLRPGTQAVELIAAFGVAAGIACDGLEEFMAHIAALRARCLAALPTLGVEVNSPADAAPHILSIACPGVPSEVMLNHLSANGVYVSAGSACSRGARSHVLSAMSLPPERLASTLRVSFSRQNTLEDVDLLLEQLAAGLKILRRAPRARKHSPLQ